MERTCTTCGVTQAIESFPKDKHLKTGRRGSCKVCVAKTMRSWRERNPDKVRANNAAHNAKAKRTLIEALGGVCACCGEAEMTFLTLDHVGQVVPPNHRWANGTRVSGHKLLKEIEAEGFPRDKYRVLCMNCNMATSYGRTCPHQKEN